jgi:hypothetical protein
LKSYDFLKVQSRHATPSGATRQYCHASGSGATSFSTSKTPSNMPYLAAPMHVAQLCYLIALAGLARPKELPDAKYFLERLILKYLLKKIKL